MAGSRLSLEHPLSTLHDLWPVMAGHGERPAILTLTPEGPASLSFASLTEQAEEVARHLRGGGLEDGQRVVLWGPGSAEWILACLGIIRAGGMVVPLDVQLGRQALQRILADCRPRFILTVEAQLERLQELECDLPQVLFFDSQDGDRSWQSLPSERLESADIKADAEAGAVLFYTSGTTGPPKGVPLSHANLIFQINQILATDLLRPDDRLLLPLPLHHVYPFALGTLVPLAAGIPIIFPQALTGPQILRALQEGEASVIAGVPRLYRALFEAVDKRFARLGRPGSGAFRTILAVGAGLRRLGFTGQRRLLAPLHRRIGPNLRLLASGGAPLDPALARHLEALGWEIAIGYGLTETSPLLTLNFPGSGRLDTVGKPLAGVEIRLADVGKGEGGKEVQVKGANVFAGYWQLPEETSRAFTDDGWFRTGDLGRFDEEGHLALCGRVSTLIVTESGKNVRPEEVEEAFEESPAIREIGIFEKGGRLVALIVPGIEEEEGEQGLRQAIAEREEQLPSHHRLAEFAVTSRALPRTRLGKIQRHLLAERYREALEGREARRGEPLALAEMAGEDRALLQSRAARETWQLFAERFPEQGLTPDSHLLHDLDLDSLEWLAVTVDIGKRTGIELNEEAIARLRTVRDLVQLMADKEAEGQGQTFAGDALEEPDAVLSQVQQRWLKPLAPPWLLVSDLLFAFNRLLLQTCFRLQVEGREHLPAQGPFVLAPNHLSSLDPLAVAAMLDKKQLYDTYWGGWTGIAFRNPAARLLSRLGRAFPVDPHRAVASSLAYGALVLRRDQNLVWFPEGERSRTGQMQPFRPGLGLLLQRYPVPVVPIFISGSHEALPPGKLIPRLTRLRLVVGPPCEIRQLIEEGEGDKDAERLVDGLQKRVADLDATLGEED
jgi:long-chain acyl-CoA synthetase